MCTCNCTHFNRPATSKANNLLKKTSLLSQQCSLWTKFCTRQKKTSVQIFNLPVYHLYKTKMCSWDWQIKGYHCPSLDTSATHRIWTFRSYCTWYTALYKVTNCACTCVCVCVCVCMCTCMCTDQIIMVTPGFECGSHCVQIIFSRERRFGCM